MKSMRRKGIKQIGIVIIIILMAMMGTMVPAYADNTGDVAVTSYKLSKIKSDKGKTKSTIEKDYTFDIAVDFMIKSDEETKVSSVTKALDGFEGGEVGKISKLGDNKYSVKIKGLKYKGGDKTLNFIVEYDGIFEDVGFKITECVEYTEPEENNGSNGSNTPSENGNGTVEPSGGDDTPDNSASVAQPSAVFSRSKMKKSLRAGNSGNVTIFIKNAGKTTMKDPVLEIAPSESIILKGSKTQFELGDIKAGSTRSVDLKIQAASVIASETQYLDASLKFNYDSGAGMEQATEAGKINLPVKLTQEKTEEEKTDAPAPNVIVSAFNYGGSSVAAGSEFDLSVTLQNTSKNLAIENIVITLDGGTDFILNGGTNTFHFDKMPAGGTKTVIVPYKVVPTITASANSVGIGLKYEYVDQKRRLSEAGELQVSVPQYQPDKFELGEPVVQMEGIVGEENSITIDYVNKGKTDMSNVEAVVTGDIESYMPEQKLGNFEPGKSGTIAFAVTPLNEGENNVTMTISYEDSNGNVKERVVETTIYATSYDPGEWQDDPGVDEPVEPEGGGSVIKLIAIPVIIIAAIVAAIVISKKRKAAKAKKQAEMMAKWDDEE